MLMLMWIYTVSMKEKKSKLFTVDNTNVGILITDQESGGEAKPKDMINFYIINGFIYICIWENVSNCEFSAEPKYWRSTHEQISKKLFISIFHRCKP